MRISLEALTETMRVERERLHSELWSTSTSSAASDNRMGYRALYNQYFKERGPQMIAWGIYPVVVLAAAVAAKHMGISPGFPLLGAIPLAYPLYKLMPTQKGLSVKELELLLPLMKLSAVEEVYARGLLSAYASNDPHLREEILPNLKRLVSESERLDRLEQTLTEARGGAIEEELKALELQLEGTADPIAREALEASIAVCQSRLVNTISERTARERIAAHRAMIHQSSLAALASLRRAQGDGLPGGQLDLSALRQSVESTGREVEALESAVQELRAL